MRWTKRAMDHDDVRALSARYGVGLLTASILARRGITDSAEIRFFLEDDLVDLHSPFHFVEMDDVVDRILRAASEGERVRIIGDRDADGISSTVLLYNELASLGIAVDWSVPLGDDPYGLTLDVVSSVAEAGGTLIVTVDCGISNNMEIERARELGIDTIVIDHHNPQENLPPAYAIINPKMEESGYPFRDLAGCGVASKVVWALRFSRTALYNRSFCLLNVRPGNETFVLEAAMVSNLVEVDRMTETIVPGMVNVDQTRVAKFLVGTEIVVYGGEAQERMLRRIFGEDVEIGLTDIAPDLWTAFPEYRDRSLLKLRELERTERYVGADSSELDTLISVFTRYALHAEPSISSEYERTLDLVALGTLADLMPLRNENRVLVRKGLAALMSTGRRGLQGLLMRQNLLGKTISTTDVAWQISPLINATGRLGVPDKAVRLLLSQDPAEVAALVEEIYSLNNERKKMGEEAWRTVLPEARESYERFDRKLVQVGGASINRGITGIIASRLMRHFKVPAFVVALLEDKAVGSARSVSGFNVKSFLDGLADLFIDYGGHDYAAGYSMAVGEYQRFRDRLSQAVTSIENVVDPDDLLEVDAELPHRYMTPKLIEVVERLEPYGEGNAPLVFLLRRAKVAGMNLMGKSEQNHVRLLLEAGKYKWPAVFWNAADRVNRDFSLGDEVDVVFRLGRNYFQARESLQLTVLEIER